MQAERHTKIRRLIEISRKFVLQNERNQLFNSCFEKHLHKNFLYLRVFFLPLNLRFYINISVPSIHQNQKRKSIFNEVCSEAQNFFLQKLYTEYIVIANNQLDERNISCMYSHEAKSIFVIR